MAETRTVSNGSSELSNGTDVLVSVDVVAMLDRLNGGLDEVDGHGSFVHWTGDN